MTGDGVPDDDMISTPWPGQGGVPQVGDPAFDALLARTMRPEDAPANLRPVAEGFDTLYRAPVPWEPSAEAAALAAFRRAASRPGRSARAHRAARPVRSLLLRARLAVAAAATAVAVAAGGVAAAAYADALPASLQRFAHDAIGAPAAPKLPHRAPSPEPSAPGRAAAPRPSSRGLCAAYARARAHGRAARQAAAFRKLAAAAGGAANVASYCGKAGVAHPGTAHTAHPAVRHHGKPGAPPSQSAAWRHGRRPGAGGGR